MNRTKAKGGNLVCLRLDSFDLIFSRVFSSKGRLYFDGPRRKSTYSPPIFHSIFVSNQTHQNTIFSPLLPLTFTITLKITPTNQIGPKNAARLIPTLVIVFFFKRFNINKLLIFILELAIYLFIFQVLDQMVNLVCQILLLLLFWLKKAKIKVDGELVYCRVSFRC